MTRPLAATCAALAALVLGGCSGDPKPDIADPTAPSTSSSATASPEASTSTSAEPGALSPEETIRAWVSGFNTVSSDGDGTELSDLSTKSCLQCSQLIDGLTKIYAQGGSIESDGWSIEKIKAHADFASSGKFSTLISSSSATIIQRPGAKPTRERAADLLVDWRLEKRSGRWFVDELTFLS